MIVRTIVATLAFVIEIPPSENEPFIDGATAADRGRAPKINSKTFCSKTLIPKETINIVPGLDPRSLR